jgi:hypothetical protein
LLEQAVAWAKKANFKQAKEFEAELEDARRESEAHQPR